MQRKRENTRLFFVWVAGLLLLFHGLIPHQHHFDSVFEHKQTEENAPLHCHAFNDIVPEKISYSFHNIITLNAVTGVHSFDLEIEPETLVLEFYNEFPYRTLTYTKHSPTRGSPVLS